MILEANLKSQASSRASRVYIYIYIYTYIYMYIYIYMYMYILSIVYQVCIYNIHVHDQLSASPYGHLLC